MKFNKIWFITLVFSLCSIVTAQSGSLDTSFDGDGIVTATVAGGYNIATSMVIQQLAPTFEEKLVVAVRANNLPAGTGQEFYIVRYNPNGTIDSTFGSGGVARVSMTPDSDYESIYSLAVQADGKIVTAGSVSGKGVFALARLNQDGSLDTTFGSNGRVLFSFGNRESSIAQAVAVQSNGNIVVAGGYGNNNFAAARLLPNGNFDTSFGGGGKVLIPSGFDCYLCIANSIAIQPNGGIVLGGKGQTARKAKADFAVMRLNPVNGTLDVTFGGTGKILTDFNGVDDELQDLAIDAGGNIVGVGITQIPNDNKFAISRYSSTGRLDLSFNGTGKLVGGSPGFVYATLFDVAIDSAGRINTAGYRGLNDIRNPILVRLNPNGTYDTSFGGTGMISTSPTNKDVGRSMVIEPDGRIIMGGVSNSDNNQSLNPNYNQLLLVRYLP